MNITSVLVVGQYISCVIGYIDEWW